LPGSARRGGVNQSLGTAPRRIAQRGWPRRQIILLAVPLGFVAALFFLPLARLFWQSVWDHGFTLKHYAAIAASPVYWRVLSWTLEIALTTSLLCLVIGYPLAYALTLMPPSRRNLVLALVILPFWTSSLVRAFAWLALLGRGGIVNRILLDLGAIDAPLPLVFNATGMYVGTVHIMLPYMIFALYAAMQGIDRGLLRAAIALGASPSRAFLRIYLPLSLQGVAAGTLLVFVITLGFFITPAILGGLRDQTFVMVIEKLMNELMNWPLAAALSTILLVVTIALYLVFARLFGLGGIAALGSAGEARQARIAIILDRALDHADRGLHFARRILRRRRAGTRARRSTPARHGWLQAWSWTVVVLTVIPIVVVILLAFSGSSFLEFPPHSLSLQWFIKYFSRTEWVAATLTSFTVATIAGTLATALALATSLGLRRLPATARTALFGLLLSPIIVPTLVYAVAVYLFFAPLGLVGTRTGVALAHAVLALPSAMVVIATALQGLDASLERAASSLGAAPWRGFIHVTLPLIRPSILTALLLAFLTSFDEVVVAIFLGGSRAVTLPKKMYESIRFDTDPTITAASAVLIALTVVILILCEIFRRQGALSRQGRGFRISKGEEPA
jgi:putative spermidine/putrescine transport system permease protein